MTLAGAELFSATFKRGQGYPFLRAAIAQGDFRDRNIEISDDEIFVSDGRSAIGGTFLDILGDQNKFAINFPVYPVYVDTNVMAGHTGPWQEGESNEGLSFSLPCTAENGFVPSLPEEHVDLIYLCFPNNPTGAVASRKQLTEWVEYARSHDALILFDAAYERYISDPAIPHSIYEIEGARECAVEFRSFSKTGGFTVCAVVSPLCRNQCLAGLKTAAAAVTWSVESSLETKSNSVTIRCNARRRRSTPKRAGTDRRADQTLHGERCHCARPPPHAGMRAHGGNDAPYIWVERPKA